MINCCWFLIGTITLNYALKKKKKEEEEEEEEEEEHKSMKKKLKKERVNEVMNSTYWINHKKIL